MMPMSIARALKFLEGEQGDMHIPLEWNKHKNLPSRKDIKNSTIKNHYEHTWYNATPFMFLLFVLL
jgi:hypothetical protein